MNCSLQAKFKDISELPRIQNSAASFGTCIHDALELYNTNFDLKEAIDRFYDTWDHPEKLGVKPDIWSMNRSYSGERVRGREILEAYDEKKKWVKRKVVATEHKFCVPFGDHELSGIVDLLEVVKGKDGNVLKIVDYKSNNRQPTKNELIGDVQFTSYMYAAGQKEFWTGIPGSPKYVGFPNGEELFEIYGDMPKRAIWYHLNGNKEIDAGARDDNDYMRLYRVACEISTAIEKEVYVPTISTSNCTFCDYKAECGIVIPIRSLLETQEVRDDDESSL